MRQYFKSGLYLLAVLWISSAQAGSYEDWFRAIHQDNPHAVVRLLQRGFDPNTVDDKGFQGLFLALQLDSTKVAEELINSPMTRVEWRSSKDESPLMIAAIRGHAKMVRELIARDADVNKPGWAPLHYAASGGHVDIIRILLDENAFIDAQSPNGTTPLMMAAGYGTPEAVKALLEAGADSLMKNQLGLTALDFARRAEHPDSIDMIESAMRTEQLKRKARQGFAPRS
jgi:ankyrin repeat protein